MSAPTWWRRVPSRARTGRGDAGLVARSRQTATISYFRIILHPELRQNEAPSHMLLTIHSGGAPCPTKLSDYISVTRASSPRPSGSTGRRFMPVGRRRSCNSNAWKVRAGWRTSSAVRWGSIRDNSKTKGSGSPCNVPRSIPSPYEGRASRGSGRIAPPRPLDVTLLGGRSPLIPSRIAPHGGFKTVSGSVDGRRPLIAIAQAAGAAG